MSKKSHEVLVVMESNCHDQESINSTVENNDLGVGRSYECVFCKRGFNTAQALGGHMNIHRKDRARNKPITSSSKPSEREVYTGSYQQIVPANHRFATYFPEISSTSSTTTRVPYYYGNNNNNYHNQEYNYDDRQPSDRLTDPGDWRMSRQEMINQKEELDLELRLGYHD
ncbi:hypothetical protein DH2020_024629 [Rehmannia glutinosa]|uniref:C2H2-type domain-containing protein n=1 Tax=Rehmannia glutinosa TaxID=99300 RepID=A0ABR0W4P1_REHGL